jgi:hypothetical protein
MGLGPLLKGKIKPRIRTEISPSAKGGLSCTVGIMQVVVDAWNVLHVQGILPPGLAGLDLAGLGRLMLASRWREGHISLVCDGAPQSRPGGIPGPIHLIWSGVDREADDVIETLITDSTSPRRLVIISSDNRLRRAARRRRCKHLASDDFLRTILDDLAYGASRATGSPETTEPADPVASPPSKKTWHDQFGMTEEDMRAIEKETAAEDFDDLDVCPRPMTVPPPPDRPAAASPSPKKPLVSFPSDLIEQAMRIARGESTG